MGYSLYPFYRGRKMIKNIPWGHNQRIMYKCKDINEALFYLQKTMDNGWSRSVLEHQIDSNLYERQGKAIMNFQAKLPEAQSDLAEQTLKNPYNFDFLSLREEYDERELEDALDDISQPIGIAKYELTKVLREEFKSSLPTIEEIESGLSE